MANQAIKNKTLGTLLKSLTDNASYEVGGHRDFAADNEAIATNHTTLKTRIAPTLVNGNAYDFSQAMHINEQDPAGSLTWAGMLLGIDADTRLTCPVDDTALDINAGHGHDAALIPPKPPGNNARERAVHVINNSSLGNSGTQAASVSNNHIIARIRQEIGAGANDARIIELIRVMQTNGGGACPTLPQAQEILQSIKTNLANALNTTIIEPVVRHLEVKIAALKRQDNSAAKRDIADLEQIKKEVASAKFYTGYAGYRTANISKFKKSLEILEGVHTKMQTYNAAVPNLDEAVGAITRYDDLLRRGNSTEQDIDDAYKYARDQCSGNPRFKCYLEELIESRDNYFRQLEVYNKVENLQASAMDVSEHLHPKKNLARSIGSAVVGAMITGAVTFWLHKAFTDTIAGSPLIPVSTITKPDGTISTTQATPAVPDKTEAPNGSEAQLIAVVCIAMLAITAYIAYHYYSRYKEDENLDPTSNKNLLNIAGIDTNKSQFEIQKVRNEVAVADFNIKKRLQNPEQPSLIQAF